MLDHLLRKVGRTTLLGAAGCAGFCAVRAMQRAERRREYRFDGKTALITGGSRGLGLVLARHLVDRGVAVAICARDPEELARAEIDLKRRGGRVLAHAFDVTDIDRLGELVREVEQEFGGIDILIKNAGMIQVGPVEAMERADYEEAMRVHFFGPLELIARALPRMKRRRGARIVNVSSFGGKVAVPHLLPYAASKYALTGLSEGLRTELDRYGIKVVTVVPGLMRTGSTRYARFKGQPKGEYGWFTIGAALPLLSMNVDRAARQIVDAIADGRAELVLTLPAKVAVVVNALAPELTADVLSLADRWILPEPLDVDVELPGAEVGAPKGAGWAEQAGEQAARHTAPLGQPKTP